MMEPSIAQYGSPLEALDEDSARSSKAPRLADQVVTDKQGRRRFHGAFTGGFSAGFFNSVGSQEGWTPSTFVSSREKRAEKFPQQAITSYMDEEDLEAFGIASKSLQATSNYDDPRTSQTAKRKRSEDWTGPIPGQPVLEALLQPINLTIGMKLLMKLGWRPGQGIGPRVSKREKSRRKRETRRKMQNQLGKEIPSSSSDDDDEDNDGSTKATFAPDDVQSYVSQKPKADQFGLGYKPLERGNVLGAEFGTAKAQPLNLFEKQKKVAIRGQAFGVGAFEEEDESIYTKDDMSDYDFSLGSSATSSAPGTKTSGKRGRSRWDTAISLMGEVLAGFHLSSAPLPPIDVAPLPSLPPDFKPWHRSNRLRFDKKETEGRERPSVEERKRLTSEAPSVEFRSGVKKSEEEENEEEEEESSVPSSFANTFTEAQDTPDEVQEGSSSSSFKPFAAYPEKQKRYEAYIEARRNRSKACVVFPLCMTEWEKEREKGEFSRIAAFSKPLSFVMSSRFTSATADDSAAGALKEGLNNMTQRSGAPAGAGSKSIPGSDVPLEEDMQAARLKTFGRLTQTQCEWHPEKILCKRFNVPDPFPQSNTVGVPSQPKEKASIFNFLSSNPFPNKEVGHLPKSARGRQSRWTKEEEKEEEEMLTKETKDSVDNFGLKVPVTGPPTLDLFKAIFQDSSESESEAEATAEQNTERTAQKTTKKVIPDKRKTDEEKMEEEVEEEEDVTGPRLRLETRKKERRPSIKDEPCDRNPSFLSTVEERKTDVSEPKRAPPPPVPCSKDDVTTRAKGVFKGIDFAALNQYRNSRSDSVDQSPARSSSLQGSESRNRGSESSESSGSGAGDPHDDDDDDDDDDDERDYGPPVPKVESEDDDEEYGPALPPHMSTNGRSSVTTPLFPIKMEEVSPSLMKVQKKVKKAKKQKFKKHKHKKKKKKEGKRRK